MNSKLVLILLQAARWCIRHARGRLERRIIGRAWDPTVSLQLDKLIWIDDLLTTHSFTNKRAV